MRIDITNDLTGRPQSCLGDGKEWADISLIPASAPDPDYMNTLALQLIWRMRRNAIDHERQLPDHDGKHFYGAALIRTNLDRYFLAPNLHLADDHTDRNCAERFALVQSKEMPLPGEKAEELWFTGGVGNCGQGIDIAPSEEGRRPPTCAACLGSLYRENPDMTVHLLPLLKPESGLVLENSYSMSDAVPKRGVITASLKELYAPEPIRITTPQAKKSLAEAAHFLGDRSDCSFIRFRDNLSDLQEWSPHLSNNEFLTAMNIMLMSKIRHLYQASGNKLRHVEIAVLKTADGEFCGATFYINGRTHATPRAASQAAYQITMDDPSPNITDVYYIKTDIAQLFRLGEIADPSSVPDVLFYPPEGSELERIRKMSKGYETMRSGAGPAIHIFIPNAIDDFDPQAHVHSRHLGDIVRMPYVGSKRVIERMETPAPGPE